VSEAANPAGDDPEAYGRLALTVDVVLIGLRGTRPAALLLRRSEPPQVGLWSLPGGFVRIDETIDAAAGRVLREKAGLTGLHLEQLYTFGALDRDPRMRIVSVAYLALLPERAFADAARNGAGLLSAIIDVPWAGEAGGPVVLHPPEGSPEPGPLPLAFDHADILALAMLRLRGKLDYSAVGFALLPERFTLRQLQDVHEAILGTPLNKPAFRRRMLDRGWLEPTGEREAGTSFRPPELYRFRNTR
jgi:8-oxo-dGTP diphosphatase